MVTISCSGCRHPLGVPEEFLGKTVTCPKCNTTMQAHTAPAEGTAEMHGAPTLAPAPIPAVAEDRLALSLTKDYNDPTLPPGTLPAIVESDETAAHAGKVSIPGYEMLGVLGRGGMGVVYKARHRQLDRRVALKMILAGSHAGDQELARFQTEAQAIARLQHPNIVQVHEVGEHEGKPFFSLEFCGGGSLSQKLGGTPLPPAEAAALLETLARAMHAAHEHKVIHRDLKPANVLLTETGVPKITDFGLAKKLDEADQTQSGAVMGTPSYMAPEQAEGQAGGIGPAADIYALGAILYECLTGRPPFKAANTLETLLQVVGSEPVPPSQLQPKTPRDLETICLHCLAKEPHKRYSTALELADELRRFQAGEPIRARPVSTTEKVVKWARRRPGMAGLAAAVALVTLVGIVAFAWAYSESIRERDNAITARGNEETERKNAENTRDALSSALTEKEKARAQAVLETENADKARIKAQNAEKERAQQLWLAERFAYHSQFREALSLFERQDLVASQLTLDQTHWDLRGPEFRYLAGLLGNKQRLLYNHNNTVESLAAAPSGKTLISAGSDHAIRIWDLERNEETQILTTESSGFSDVAISPDGKRLYSRCQISTIKEWDLETGKEIRCLFTYPNVQVGKFVAPKYRRLSLSPDGSFLAALIEPHPFPKKDEGPPTDQIKLWNLKTGMEVFSQNEPSGSVLSLAIAPDGKRLLANTTDAKSKFEIKIWEVESGKEIGTLRDTAESELMTFAPDGKRLYLNCKRLRNIIVWDLEAKTHKFLPGHTDQVRSLAVSADSKRLYSGSYDGVIKIWDLTLDKEIASLRGQTDGVECLALSTDGQRLFAGGQSGAVMAWSLAAGENFLPLNGIAHNGQAIRFLLTPDGNTLFSGGTDRVIKVFDLQGKKPMVDLRGHSAEIRDLALSPDGKRLYSSGGEVKVWDLENLKELATLPLPHVPPMSGGMFGLPFHFPGSLVLAQDGKRLFSAGMDAITEWDLEAGKEAITLPEKRALRLAVSPDGKWLFAALTNQAINVWDLQEGKIVFTLKGHTIKRRPNTPQLGMINALAVSADSKRLFSAGSDHIIKVWDIATGADLMTLEGHNDDVVSFAVTPDGRRLFSGSEDQTIILWDLELHKEILTLRGHPSYVAALALTHDGKRLLSMSSRPMAWSLDAGREIATLRGHHAMVDSLVLGKDQRQLISAAAAGPPKFWDLQTGTEIPGLSKEQLAAKRGGNNVPAGANQRLAVSANGRLLVSGRGTSVSIWDLREGKELGTLAVESKLGITCLALWDEGQRLFTATGEGIRTWDLETRKEVALLPDTMKYISCLLVSPDGRLFAIGTESSPKNPDGKGEPITIKSWDLKTGKECPALSGTIGLSAPAGLAISADGQRLYVGTRDFRAQTGTITEWDLSTGKQVRVLSGHTGPVRSLLLATNGRRLVAGDSTGAIVIWDLEASKAILTLRGHQGATLGLALCADGKHLISSSDDHTIKIWDVAAELAVEIQR